MSKQEYQLRSVALKLREVVLEMCLRNGGHIATSYSCAEILTSLYNGVLRVDTQKPLNEKRDRFILSKGHGETILYAVLAEAGFFPEEWLFSRYRKGDCLLGGHANHHVPGVDFSTGALGHGLNIGCGMALGAKKDGEDWSTFVLLGDAECSEGSVWEAAMFATQHKLGNLVAIIDQNHIGALDRTCDYIPLDPLADKGRAFGWDVHEVDGHDVIALHNTLLTVRDQKGDKPHLIVAKTVKGKGVSLFEDDPSWHTRGVTEEIAVEAQSELALIRKELEALA